MLRSLKSILYPGERASLVVSALLLRGVGFLSSLVVSREAGALALGVYSGAVNTVASVAQPATGALYTAGTLSVRLNGNEGTLRSLLLAYLAWTAILSILLFFALHLALTASSMLERASGLALSAATLCVAASLALLGNLLGSMISGLLSSTRLLRGHSYLTSACSLVLMASTLPLVSIGGLHGAIMLMALSSLLPAALSFGYAWSNARDLPVYIGSHHSSWTASRARIIECLPGAATLVLLSAFGWTCTVYLTQQAHGLEGVALVAVAGQWITLTLIPVTSWRGILLRELLTRHSPESRAVDWVLVKKFAARNCAVTGSVGVTVALASGFLSQLYLLESQGLRLMLLLGGAVALVSSVASIAERVLVCQSRQRLVFVATLGSGITQVATTASLLDLGPWTVVVAQLVAQIVLVSILLGCLLIPFTYRAR